MKETYGRREVETELGAIALGKAERKKQRENSKGRNKEADRFKQLILNDEQLYEFFTEFIKLPLDKRGKVIDYVKSMKGD